MKWIKKLLKEEKAQGAIEYILLAGGVIVAAVVVFAVYKRMAESVGNELENTANQATGTMKNIVENEIANMG